MSDSAVDQTEQSSERQWEPEDKLKRKKASQFLTRYLTKKFEAESQGDALGSSFVLNINAHWGFGKTYFLTNWAEDLRLAGYPVVFFNAWENDCFDDPMVAFIAEIQAELKKLLPDENKSQKFMEPVKKEGIKLFRTGAIVGSKLLASAVTKKITGYTIDQIGSLCDEAGDESIDEPLSPEKRKEIETALAKISEETAKEAIDRYSQSKDQVESFKISLGKLVSEVQGCGKKAPLFIFIDELDRCRPTYAIEVLEKIKHIFDIPDVYFVVATASGQLCHSIKAVYGEGFDAETYLKRFFDQIYEFEKPDYYSFADYLFVRYGLDNFSDNLFSPLLNEEGVDENIQLFSMFSEYFQLGLRDQEQVAKNLLAVCLGWDVSGKIHLAWLLFLMMMKHRSDEAFIEVEKNPGAIDNLGVPMKFRDLTFNVTFKVAPAVPHIRRGDLELQDVSLITLVKKYVDYMRGNGPFDNSTKSYESDIYKELLPVLNHLPGGRQAAAVLRDYYWYVKQIGRFTLDLDPKA